MVVLRHSQITTQFHSRPSQKRCRTPRICIPTAILLTTESGRDQVDRKAFDVAVIGDTYEAYFTALQLRRAGRRVLLVEHVHPRALSPLDSLQQLTIHLPDADPVLLSMTANSTDAYRSLFSGVALKSGWTECESLDMGILSDPSVTSSDDSPPPPPPPTPSSQSTTRGDGTSSATTSGRPSRTPLPPPPPPPPKPLTPRTLRQVAETCAMLGLPHSILSSSQVTAKYPLLSFSTLGKTHAALYCPDAVAFRPKTALSLLRSVLRRAEVDVRESASVAMHGWEDKGSHFALRIRSVSEDESPPPDKVDEFGEKLSTRRVTPLTSQLASTRPRPRAKSKAGAVVGTSTEDLTSRLNRVDMVAECEQIVLCVGTATSHILSRAFGVPVPGLSRHAWLSGTVPLVPGDKPRNLPLVRYHACDDVTGSERPDRQGGWSSLLPRSGGCYLLSTPKWDATRQAFAFDDAAATAAVAARNAKQACAIDPRLEAATRGLGTVFGPKLIDPRVTPLPLGKLPFSRDGRPLLGSLPGFERGRIIVSCAPENPNSAPLLGPRIAPVLGEWTASYVLGKSLPDGAAEALDLLRLVHLEGVERVTYDTWNEYEERVRPMRRIKVVERVDELETDGMKRLLGQNDGRQAALWQEPPNV